MKHHAAAVGLGFTVLALVSAHVPKLHAQSADLVLCDRIAADPSDPDKPADVPGVTSIAKADVATGIKFCRTASASSRRAMFQLGRTYAAGGQMAEAVAAYRKAIEKGSTSAMVELGVLYGTGSGVAKDDAQAKSLFQRAAAAGNPRGDANIAMISGGGTNADPVQARAAMGKAADANSPEAQFQLGLMLANGDGGPKDDVAARTLFEKAAAKNHAGAMVALGVFLQDGRGGSSDRAMARSYYEKAAALGNPDAKTAIRRLDCPRALKDKNGNVLAELC
jgi:TPR repeat protein